MKTTILVCGHGPGISDSVARRFGRAGFAVAIVARNQARLTEAAAALTKEGITARGYACDLGDEAAVRALVQKARRELGPIGVINWNVYTGAAPDLLTASLADIRIPVESSTFGLIAAVQEALPDLKEQKGSVLVTGGGFSAYDANIDRLTVEWGFMGLALSKAAQHKLTGLLHARLAKENVYVGEVVVMGQVKGTAFDHGQATLNAADIAERFWELHTRRDVATVNFS